MKKFNRFEKNSRDEDLSFLSHYLEMTGVEDCTVIGPYQKWTITFEPLPGEDAE